MVESAEKNVCQGTNSRGREKAPGMEGKNMKQISLNNGRNYMDVDEAMTEIMERSLWETVVSLMDDGIREAVADDMAPCSEEEFLKEYLARANDDLVVG